MATEDDNDDNDNNDDDDNDNDDDDIMGGQVMTSQRVFDKSQQQRN